MKNGQFIFAAVLAFVALGGCAQEEKAQAFGARAELAKLNVGGGPPAAKEKAPVPPGSFVFDRAGRTSFTMPTPAPNTSTPTNIGPGAHGEVRGKITKPANGLALTQRR